MVNIGYSSNNNSRLDNILLSIFLIILGILTDPIRCFNVLLYTIIEYIEKICNKINRYMIIHINDA